MQAAGGVRRAARSVLDVRRPLRGVGSGGVILVVACTYSYARHVGRTGPNDWVPAAVAASFGWLCLLLCAISTWECVRIARHQPPLELADREPSRWRREWIAPLVVATGVLLGWAFFK